MGNGSFFYGEKFPFRDVPEDLIFGLPDQPGNWCRVGDQAFPARRDGQGWVRSSGGSLSPGGGVRVTVVVQLLSAPGISPT